MPDLSAALAQLKEKGLLRQRRTLAGPQGPHVEMDGKRYLAFCSNDYLGLANDPRIIDIVCRAASRYGVGAGASPLICGHSLPHEKLEQALARFVGCERALHFSTGYMANIGVVQVLVGKGDAVFSDELNHASLIDGVRLSNARTEIYSHGDMTHLEFSLASSTAPRKLVVSDVVFSMDGDFAPVKKLVELCDRYDAWLLLDDAHGFGVIGKQGRGALSHFGVESKNVIYMGTLGKAAGVAGAFLAGSADLVEWLLQTARSYIFTTAAPPMLAAGLLASLRLIETEENRRVRLHHLIDALKDGLKDLPWRLLPSDTAIQPLLIGDNDTAVGIMNALMDLGIWVPAIRPPTVPRGTARLRISLSAGHSVEDVGRLVEALRAMTPKQVLEPAV